MDLNPIKEAFDGVTKKQNQLSSKSHEVINLLSEELEKALQAIQLGRTSAHKPVLLELQAALQETASQNQLEETRKEVSLAISKYSKLLEKSFNPDISKAYRDVEFDTRTLNQIIAGHFYRRGLFEIGDYFLNESGTASEVRSFFWEMYAVLDAMEQRNLKPALKWASANSDKLKEHNSDLHLKLHRLQFLEVLRESKTEALVYARNCMMPFATDHFSEFQKDMGCLLFSRTLEQSPYAGLLSDSNWKAAADEFKRQFCNVIGQSSECPLSVAVAAGCQGLPSLLKFMTVTAGRRQDWQTMKQLPVPVELQEEFVFHSVFVCPVSKEQSTDENPPMLMSCGHVLCMQSISKMSKNGTKSFKCPYCPYDVDALLCKHLHL